MTPPPAPSRFLAKEILPIRLGANMTVCIPKVVVYAFKSRLRLFFNIVKPLERCLRCLGVDTSVCLLQLYRKRITVLLLRQRLQEYQVHIGGPEQVLIPGRSHSGLSPI